MSLSIELSGRRALVTGVTQGIGFGIARSLAQAGSNVIGCGIESADHVYAQRFIDEVESNGVEGHYFRSDLGEVEGAAQLVESAVGVYGALDLVVSNAGRNVFRGIDACSEDDWNECISLDLAAHWRLAKHSRPHLESSRNAVIILISSNHAFSTLPNCFPYNVTKAGINAMVQSLALEWGPWGRAIGIAPGFIDTPGNDAWFESFSNPGVKRAEVESGHPVGRIGTPDEIGALCSFLASDHARFISGSTILVDGGNSASMGW